MSKPIVTVCWIRRDLRLEDHAALYHALRSSNPVLIFFNFDAQLLSDLNNPADPRVTFIHQELRSLKRQLENRGSSLYVSHELPINAWNNLLQQFEVKEVHLNRDYEPYADQRDKAIKKYLNSQSIPLYTHKDQVIFEQQEIIKKDGSPYTVFTPYARQWEQKINDFFLRSYPLTQSLDQLLKIAPLSFPTLEELGFRESKQSFPSPHFEERLTNYESSFDYPGADASSRIGIHLRFGTISIRKACRFALENGLQRWLKELIWREFYMMILWHFPQSCHRSFKPAYDLIPWKNDLTEFDAWCQGETGYALVDAGMKQLLQTGFMHNRIRMLTASFLCKHLLIDWRWGEQYFASKLLDYEQASNVGGWQWACGSGNDAAPYFRIFNPALQQKKFDADGSYVQRWAPEYKNQEAKPLIVAHDRARERALSTYKKALQGVNLPHLPTRYQNRE